jgi:hypothetical protein
MKCFLFACLILATATVAEAGGRRNSNQRAFNQGFNAGARAAQRNQFNNCNHGGNFNQRAAFNQGFRQGQRSAGGGQRNVNFGFVNIN